MRKTLLVVKRFVFYVFIVSLLFIPIFSFVIHDTALPTTVCVASLSALIVLTALQTEHGKQ